MTDEERDLLSHLMEEYKILQEKIDKIGAARFTIKGWSVTVIVGSLLAGSAVESLMHLYWAFLLGLLVWAFFIFECQQTSIRDRFAARVFRIEEEMTRVLREDARKAGGGEFITLRYVPGIGHQLRRGRANPGRAMKVLLWFWENDVWFYLLLSVFIAVATVSRPASHDAKGGITIIDSAPSSSDAQTPKARGTPEKSLRKGASQTNDTR